MQKKLALDCITLIFSYVCVCVSVCLCLSQQSIANPAAQATPIFGEWVLACCHQCGAVNQTLIWMNGYVCLCALFFFFYSTWLFEIFVCGRVFFNFCLAVLHRHFATQFELCAMPRRFEQTECRVNCCGERGM